MILQDIRCIAPHLRMSSILNRTGLELSPLQYKNTLLGSLRLISKNRCFKTKTNSMNSALAIRLNQHSKILLNKYD